MAGQQRIRSWKGHLARSCLEWILASGKVVHERVVTALTADLADVLTLALPIVVVGHVEAGKASRTWLPLVGQGERGAQQGECGDAENLHGVEVRGVLRIGSKVDSVLEQ